MIINFELNIKTDKTRYTEIIEKDVSFNLRYFLLRFLLRYIIPKIK